MEMHSQFESFRLLANNCICYHCNFPSLTKVLLDFRKVGSFLVHARALQMGSMKF